MKPEITRLHEVWEHEMKAVQRTDMPVRFDEIVSSIFTAGPSYYYVVDFFDMKLSNISPAVKEIHGLEPATTTFNDILGLIHPDDVEFVSNAEAAIIRMFQQIGWHKLLKYKGSYCLRFRVADGSYKLFLHQNLVLTLDEKGGFAKSLNIHTDISHITSINNYKLSMIGLQSEPSYLDIDVMDSGPGNNSYTKRETQVLKMISEGLTNSQIADKLSLALDTVKNHRRNLLAKAGVKNTAQLISHSILKGLI